MDAFTLFFYKRMRGVIEKIDGVHAMIRLESGESLVWPTSKLPQGARVTSVVDCTVELLTSLDTDAAAASRRQLNDILASSPDA